MTPHPPPRPPRRHRRIVITVAVVALAAGVVYWLVPPRAPRDLKVITYATPVTIAAIPAYVAHEKGFWTDEGLDVRPQMFSSGRLALDALLSKDAEVMSVSETPLMHSMMRGDKIFIVATVTDHQETKFIGRRDRGIASAADLRGKRLATLPGTNSDYFRSLLLADAGIPPAGVTSLNLNPPDMITALVRGDIDGYFAWEPHVYYAREKLGDNAVVLSAGGLYHGRHCVAMNQDFVRANPEVVEKLVRGFIRAERFVEENQAEAQAIVARTTGMDESALRALWAEYRVRVSLDGDLLRLLGREMDWARSAQPTGPAAPEPRAFVYPDALEKARPTSVALDK